MVASQVSVKGGGCSRSLPFGPTVCSLTRKPHLVLEIWEDMEAEGRQKGESAGSCPQSYCSDVARENSVKP